MRLIKYNKSNGDITTYLSFGVSWLDTTSLFDYSILTGGSISSTVIIWGIIDMSTNSPSLRCNATLPTINYNLFDSHLISLTDYILLLTTY